MATRTPRPKSTPGTDTEEETLHEPEEAAQETDDTEEAEDDDNGGTVKDKAPTKPLKIFPPAKGNSGLDIQV